jgi:hypothetical protein
LARLAILLCEDSRVGEHLHLARILDFFGIPWKIVEVSQLLDVEGGTHDHVLFGSPRTVAAAFEQIQKVNHSVVRQAAFYVYTDDDRDASERGFKSLCGNPDVSLRQVPTGNLLVQVSRELAEVSGPMTGVEVSLQLRREDTVLAGVPNEESGFATVVSAGGDPVFVRFQKSGIPIFFCASSHMINIDQTVGPGFYDVKEHFCSVVPLVMFVRFIFPEIAWQPQELGACLIIDDPLLRRRYGSCDFGVLRDLMRQYGFTTNIAFIPWNWRRTSPSAGKLFRNESDAFSVSIHGCDHIDAEFGETSPRILNNRAKLALSRMRNHDTRTGIHHDPVMVFPQGVFSSECPKVLKRNGFLAAVNTETHPADSSTVATQIRDVWDVAIMRYGDFPIFTRRYAHHGLENFAFDLLLGKPCLIVSHHDFFKDGCAELIELIEKLRSLNCSLHWRPLGEVIRRACRRRVNEAGVEEVEMYANELLIHNPLDRVINVNIRKRENEPDLVSEVQCDRKPLMWTTIDDHVVFEERIKPCGERHLQVFYREQEEAEKVDRSLRFELSVAMRRILSELRDNYFSRSRFLSTTAAKLKNAFAKAN